MIDYKLRHSVNLHLFYNSEAEAEARQPQRPTLARGETKMRLHILVRKGVLGFALALAGLVVSTAAAQAQDNPNKWGPRDSQILPPVGSECSCPPLQRENR